jgi:hypothetical protein
MKPDVIITWPTGCDYPLCRAQLKMSRKYFNKVIIVFNPKGPMDFSEFIQKAHKDFTCLSSSVNDEHWREASVTMGLKESTSDEVIFTEQDFFWKDTKFLETVAEARKKYDTVGIRNGNRLHPCFIQTSRAMIEQTSKDFAVQGQDKDHFQKFSEEVLAKGSFIDLKDIGLFEGVDWYHFSSMTWNLMRVQYDDVKEMHELAEFLVYNTYSRTKQVKQDPRWLAHTFYTELMLTKFGKFLNS